MKNKILCAIIGMTYIINTYSQSSAPVLVIEAGQDLSISSEEQVIFSRNNRYLALAGLNEIRLYDLKTGLFFKKIKQENDYSYVQFSADFRHFSFTRLQNINEPDDSKSFTAVAETFSNKYVFRQRHKTNDYNEYLRPVNQYIFRRKGNRLEFIKPTGTETEAIVFQSPAYDIDGVQERIIVSDHDPEKYFIISLQHFDTTAILDFCHNGDEVTIGFEKQLKKIYGTPYLISPKVYFAPDPRYIYLSGEYFSNHKVFKIYDLKRDTVIFSKVYELAKGDQDIFLRSINFSPVSGAVTIPSHNGLFVFNIRNQDSLFIPLSKTRMRQNVYLSADGNTVVLNNKDTLQMYNAYNGRKLLQTGVGFSKVFINPSYPLIYLSTETYSRDNVTWIYDTQKEKVTDSTNVELVQISPNGKLLYGKVQFKNFLFNQHVVPIRQINGCTPYTDKAFELNEQGYAIMVNNSNCDFNMQRNIPTFDFSAWNLNTLGKLKNDLADMYTFSYDLLKGSFFYNNNFFLTSGFTMNSFADTMSTNAINKRYGDLKCIKGNYFLYCRNEIVNLLSGKAIGDTISLFKNNRLIGKFCATGISFPAAGIDTIKKQLILLADNGSNILQKKLVLYTYAGAKLKEKLLTLPGGLLVDWSSATIEGICNDNSFIHLALREGLTDPKTRHVVLNTVSSKAVVDFAVSKFELSAINCTAKKYVFVDSNNFVNIGSFSNGKRTSKVYALAIRDSLLLAIQPPGDNRDFRPASTLFTPNGSYKLFLYNWITGDTLFTTNITNEFVKTGAVSSNHKWIAIGNYQGQVTVWYLPVKEPHDLNGHTDYIASLSFATDNHKLISTSTDGACKLWSLDSLKEIITIINLTNEDYIITSPDGYYACTKDARNQFAFFLNEDVLGPDQLDLFYNRPDALLRRIGSRDTARIQASYNAWEKRIQRSGLGGGKLGMLFNAPILTITNLDSIEINTSSSLLPLRIHSIDSIGFLRRFNIWINQCPLLGAGGIQITGDRHAFDTLLSVNLSADSNIIELAVTNEHGIESYRQPIFVRNTGSIVKPALWFIGIGVANYSEPGKKLNYAVKDIIDLDSVFRSRCQDDNTTYRSILLLDKDATREHIMSLRDSLMKTNIDDKVIVEFSGHGLISDSLDLYLGTEDMNFAKPQKRGLSYQSFDDLLDGIPARKKLVLIDACHSGESDNKKDNTEAADVFGEEVDKLKAMAQSKKLGLQNSFDLMQELFSDISVNTGATVISAARGNQSANEGDQWKNGAFTFCLKEGLADLKADTNHNGHVTVSELKNFVIKEVKYITDEKQQPTSRQETIRNNWVIW